MAASTARSQPQGLARPEGTALPPESFRVLLVHTWQRDLELRMSLQLGKGSGPWLQSLAPFLPCLQADTAASGAALTCTQLGLGKKV